MEFFSGSAADMLKKYGQAVPEQQQLGQQFGGPLVGELLDGVAPLQRGVVFAIGHVRAPVAVLEHHGLGRDAFLATLDSIRTQLGLAIRVEDSDQDPESEDDGDADAAPGASSSQAVAELSLIHI